MFKKNDLKIEFFSSHPYLNDIPECRPMPLSKVLPDWWSKFNSKELGPGASIKDCPSFAHMFSSAYVVPMWVDVAINVNENKEVSVDVADKAFTWKHHFNYQFLDQAPQNIKDNVSIILKPDCPWHVKTPKGYSLYQTGSFYHFNENFDIMPGIINTDLHPEINQQLLISSKPGSFVIKRGEPFAVYFPFKRDKFKLETRAATENDRKRFERSHFWISGKFAGGYKEMVKYHEDKKAF
jgi:hypothetical protein